MSGEGIGKAYNLAACCGKLLVQRLGHGRNDSHRAAF
jgi:hypothetical protein